MSSFEFAPRITRLSSFDVTATQQVASGEPVRVWGVLLSNVGANTGGILTVESAAGVDYFVTELGIRTTVVVDIPFIADAGLQVTLSTSGASDAELEVTVFHSHPGS